MGKKFFSNKSSKNSKTQARTRTNKSRPSNKKQSSSTQSALRGGAGYREYQGDALWLPSTSRPVWLDGSMPGDRGFDPLGSFKPTVDEITTQSLQPYSEVFGLQRFRECELIHGRWAMMGTLGVIVAESATGVSWVDAGKVELDGARYLNFELPFTLSQLCWIEFFAVGGAELYRNGELDSEKRIYPGGLFDPLGLASAGKARDEQINRLREAEIKHGRLAMVAFFGFFVQALA